MTAKKESNVRDLVAMVGLDLTEMDDHLIEYLGILMQALPFKRIFFVHVAKELELPKEVTEQYPDLLAPLDESIAEGIRHKVSHLFDNNGVEFDVIVQEGAPIENFLRITKIKQADLIIMGRKKNLKGSGLLSGHIVRSSPTSMLFVTETFNPEIKNVLVPVDFSQHASLALDLAKQINEHCGASIQLSNIYSVPIGFYKTGKSHAEFAEIMKKHATNDLIHFLKKRGVTEKLPCEFILENKESKADLINTYAHSSGMDLILIGSRGRTRASAILIGSIVEKLLLLDFDIPLLVVKNKGENMGFINALLKL